MTEPITVGRLRIDSTLHEFVEREALPGTGIAASRFWAGVESILAEFTPRNRALLAQRDELQARIDDWWREHKGQPFDVAAHTAFLTDIGYLQPPARRTCRSIPRARIRKSPPWPGRSWWCR